MDGVDVPLSMTRAELATLCEAELGGIRSLVRGCLEEAAMDAGSLAGAQAFGGGCRMPIVQDMVRDEVWYGGTRPEWWLGMYGHEKNAWYQSVCDCTGAVLKFELIEDRSFGVECFAPSIWNIVFTGRCVCKHAAAQALSHLPAGEVSMSLMHPHVVFCVLHHGCLDSSCFS